MCNDCDCNSFERSNSQRSRIQRFKLFFLNELFLKEKQAPSLQECGQYLVEEKDQSWKTEIEGVVVCEICRVKDHFATLSPQLLPSPKVADLIVDSNVILWSHQQVVSRMCEIDPVLSVYFNYLRSEGHEPNGSDVLVFLSNPSSIVMKYGESLPCLRRRVCYVALHLKQKSEEFSYSQVKIDLKYC